MPRYRIQGSYEFQAWPESVLSARAVRAAARETAVGHLHLVSAAIVLTAYSVEAFAMTLGPEAYGESWEGGKGSGSRAGLRDKLKRIGSHFGRKVDFGVDPWSEVLRLIDARDKLAHPKPRSDFVDVVFTADDETHARLISDEAMRTHLQPLHNIDVLEQAAARIESALLDIWVASSRSPHALKGWMRGTYSLSEVE